jgi:cytoskeletal protein CcmA (bactofilin family)
MDFFRKVRNLAMLSKGKQGELEGFLGPNTNLKGELRFKEFLRIDGNFDGVVESGGTLQVGETGHLTARINSKNVEISGKVEGTLKASGMVSILHQGRVVGDITTPILIVEEGAILDGKCNMLNAKENLSKGSQEALPLKSTSNRPEEGKK